MLPWGSVALGHSSKALPPASRRLPSQASSRFGFRRGDRPPRVSIRSRSAALLSPKNDRSRNPSAIFAPRFPSARFELRRPGLAPNGTGNIAVPEVRSMGRPSSSPGGLAEGISVPDSGRHPTLDGSIREAFEGVKPLREKELRDRLSNGARCWSGAAWSSRAKPPGQLIAPTRARSFVCKTANIADTAAPQDATDSPRAVPSLSTGNSHFGNDSRQGTPPRRSAPATLGAARGGWRRTRRASSARPSGARRARRAGRCGSG